MVESGLGVAVLAAGSSQRFGTQDKLAASFRGRPLGEHVCKAIPPDAFSSRWVIAAKAGHPCEPAWVRAGFDMAINASAHEGMGTSVALAARLALEADCKALLIALGDMPLVPGAHFLALVRRANEIGEEAIIISQIGETRTPPAVFGCAHFLTLADLGGDTGARRLLQKGEVVPCPPEWLEDIDTPEALARLSKL